jgi:biopolymer transport protein ExbD
MTQNEPKESTVEKEAAAVLTRRAQRIIRKQHRFEELNLVPYMDVMVNLIIFLLVTTSTFLPMGMLSIFPFLVSSKTVDQPEEQKAGLNFTVFITKSGFTLGGTGGILNPIPKKANGEYDFDALAQKAVEVKNHYPTENMVILSADQEIKYDILVRTMDTLREKDNRPLFDDVQLSPGFIRNP